MRDSRQVPRFYVAPQTPSAPRAGRPAAQRRGKGHARRASRSAGSRCASPADAPPLRDRLIRAGIPCHEADVRFAMRYLIDRGVRGALAIRAAARRARAGVVFDDPAVRPADWTPRLRVLSLDIETDPQRARLLSIALHGCGAPRCSC